MWTRKAGGVKPGLCKGGLCLVLLVAYGFVLLLHAPFSIVPLLHALFHNFLRSLLHNYHLSFAPLPILPLLAPLCQIGHAPCSGITPNRGSKPTISLFHEVKEGVQNFLAPSAHFSWYRLLQIVHAFDTNFPYTSCGGMAIFNTKRGDQNFFYFVRGGRNFCLVLKGGDQFFFHS